MLHFYDRFMNISFIDYSSYELALLRDLNFDKHPFLSLILYRSYRVITLLYHSFVNSVLMDLVWHDFVIPVKLHFHKSILYCQNCETTLKNCIKTQ